MRNQIEIKSVISTPVSVSQSFQTRSEVCMVNFQAVSKHPESLGPYRRRKELFFLFFHLQSHKALKPHKRRDMAAKMMGSTILPTAKVQLQLQEERIDLLRQSTYLVSRADNAIE